MCPGEESLRRLEGPRMECAMSNDRKYGDRQSITVGQVRELSPSYTLPKLAKAIEALKNRGALSCHG